MTKKSFKDIIKSARTKKNLSQEELAFKLSVPVVNVKNWEKGKNLPTTKVMPLLLKELDLLDLKDEYMSKRSGRPRRIDDVLLVNNLEREIRIRKQLALIPINVFELRLKLGLNQSEFASKIGLSGNNYCHYESGDRQFPLGVLLSICEECNVKLDDLIDSRGR